MSNITTITKVPMGQKIAFGFGMLANQMFPAIISIFIVVLVQSLGFPGWMWGVVSLVPRLFDAITDPIMGYISDNTRSRWGRRRQYVFLGSIIMGISFIIMWQLFKENSMDYNFYYFLFWSLVFYLGLTIFSVPYVAMGYEMSDDFHERTNIMAVAQFIGQWAWVIAPWFWILMDDKDWFPSSEVAVRELAIWVAIVCMILAMIPAIFIKSKSTLNEDYEDVTFKNILKKLRTIFVVNFKEALKMKPFRKLCIATFLVFNAFNTVAAFTYFIIVYYLFDGVTGPDGAWWWPTLFGSIGALVTSFLVIPAVTKMSKSLGKKKAFVVSQSISIVGYIMLWFLFIPGKPYMFLFALPFFSFGIGGLFTLMMSMTADVIDLDELNTGKRREGVFGAIYWWMVKFGFGIAGGLTGLIFSIIGFESGAATQTEEALTGLRLFFSGLPIFGTLLAIYVMSDYDITEERAGEIRDELNKRKTKNIETKQELINGN
nr:MFS transporter [uncultured Psychroserpens sp.]